ncbi:hypothetical protein PanWU01x14_121910 [Parasponia andersonii]|uniref:Uncharacterized protein n=1 Tax=Parasponia andersonii TaxID=3476 RepID=A0A2P5CUU3_PARAD|nr:hypothetical protein PanWU01x14_121910 [Parasponia andersonii]
MCCETNTTPALWSSEAVGIKVSSSDGSVVTAEDTLDPSSDHGKLRKLCTSSMGFLSGSGARSLAMLMNCSTISSLHADAATALLASENAEEDTFSFSNLLMVAGFGTGVFDFTFSNSSSNNRSSSFSS